MIRTLSAALTTTLIGISPAFGQIAPPAPALASNWWEHITAPICLTLIVLFLVVKDRPAERKEAADERAKDREHYEAIVKGVSETLERSQTVQLGAMEKTSNAYQVATEKLALSLRDVANAMSQCANKPRG